VDFQLTFAESALVDLEEILTYSWTNFPDTAERFGAALLDHVELLKRFPLMGTPVLNRPGVRRLVHTPILVYLLGRPEAKDGRSHSLSPVEHDRPQSVIDGPDTGRS